VAIPEHGRDWPAFAVAAWVVLGGLLAGCASQPVHQPSISAQGATPGKVTLSYEYKPGEPRTPDWGRAGQKARHYCRERGYDEAEMVGEPVEECRADNRYRRCTLYYVSRSWQCRHTE
jgi:hypothetical protein